MNFDSIVLIEAFQAITAPLVELKISRTME
jgi:hypothetical protein